MLVEHAFENLSTELDFLAVVLRNFLSPRMKLQGHKSATKAMTIFLRNDHKGTEWQERPCENMVSLHIGIRTGMVTSDSRSWSEAARCGKPLHN